MPHSYEVRVTKQAQEQMSEIFDYICEELFARDAAITLLNKMKLEDQPLSLNKPHRYLPFLSQRNIDKQLEMPFSGISFLLTLNC